MNIGDRVVITWGARTLTGQIEQAFGSISLRVQLDEPILAPNAVVPVQSLPLIWEGDSYHIIGASWCSVTVERGAGVTPASLSDQLSAHEISR